MQGFASLRWLDAAISFLFRLIGKLAEPFLVGGLIASAADYGTHGAFFNSHHFLLSWWVGTQAIALEGSGGIALAMSFEAAAEGDNLKAMIQRSLALALLVTGGIMFFVELVSSASGFNEAAMPPAYIWSMSALRTIVSVGYIAICRTAMYRFGRAVPPAHSAQPSLPQPDVLAAQIREVLQGELPTIAQSVKNEVATTVQVMIQNAQPLPAHSSESARRSTITEVRKETPRSAHALKEPTILELSPAQRVTAQETEDRRQSTEPLPVYVVDVQPSGQGSAQSEDDAQSRVFQYLYEYADAHGSIKGVTLEMLMEQCVVAKNTASKYRRDWIEQQGVKQ